MIRMLDNWKGAVEIDGIEYKSIQEARSVLNVISDDIHIILKSNNKNANMKRTEALNDVSDKEQEYEITVKKYMTQQATPSFDFMMKWNDNNPMPMRIMQGTVEKETRGMVYMKLHGMARPTITCFCCGKELTNPISRKYGIGPICLGKMGIARDIDDVEGISEELVNISWEGWIIKSAITEKKAI